MKKRILALILTVAMMVAVLPFSAITASAAAGDGIKGTMVKVPIHSGFTDEFGTYHMQSTDLNYMSLSSIGAKRMYKKLVNGEWFWIAPHTYAINAENGTTPDGTPVLVSDSEMFANTGYGATAWATMDVAETDYVAIRIRFNNNSDVIDYTSALFTVSVCGVALTNNDASPILWYDLEDNSLQRWYRINTQYDSSNTHFSIKGDINGYMLVPVANLGGAAKITGAKPTLKFVFAGEANGAATSNNKISWANKEMLIGDALVVDKDAFVTAKKNASGYGKYTSVAGDTGITLHRTTAFDYVISSYFNTYISESLMKGKLYARNDTSAAGSCLHYVSLPNGDRAIDLSTPLDDQARVLFWAGSQNTYDNARTTYSSNYGSGYTTKGIPAELQVIDNKVGESYVGENDGIAIRVAATGNEGQTFNLKLAPAKNSSGDSLNSSYLAKAGGVIKYVDAKTGEVKDVTLTSAGIPITGNIDGWFVVPDFSANYWTACSTNAFFSYFNGFKSHYGWIMDVTGLSSTTATQKCFVGDIQFVKDDEAYVAAHANAAKMKPSAASLSLADDLYVNYKVNIARHDIYGLDLPTTANFTVADGETVTVNGVKDGNNLVFTLTGMNPQKIGDNITTVLSNGTATGAAHNYSIKTYANNMIANAGSSDSLKTLMADLLNYGAAAQEYAKYKTDALVNADLDQSLATDVLAAVESKTAHEALEGATHLWKSAALRLNEKVEFKFMYKMAEGATCNGGYIKATDESGKVIGTRAFDAGSSVARFMGLNADEMRKVVKFQLFDKQDNPISGVLTYSIESYVAAKKDDANIGALVTAMMKYGDSAANYR